MDGADISLGIMNIFNKTIVNLKNSNMQNGNETGVGVTSFENVTNAACRQYQTDSTSVAFSYRLTTFLCIAIIAIGILCNILGIIVFRSKAMSKSTTAVYLSILALSDLIYLITIFLARSLNNLKCLYYPDSTIDIYHRSSFMCKGLQYLLDLFADYSACLILVVTIERFIACYHAVYYKKNCSLATSKIITGCVFIVLVIFNLPNHMLYVKHYPENNVCDYSKEHERIFDYLYMTEVTLFRVIPTFAIAVFNMAIIVKLYKRSTEKQQRSSSNKSSISSVSSKKSVASTGSESSTATNVTLVFISTLYIICYLPILICYVFSKLTIARVLSLDSDTLILFRNYSSTLYVVGYAVNFFLYTIAGRVFRQEVKRLLCPRCYTNRRGL